MVVGNFIVTSIAIGSCLLMACEPTDFTYTIDIQASPGSEIRDITTSDGIRVVGGQREQIVTTAPRNVEFPPITLQLVVNQQEVSRETFTPYMCGMACGTEDCDPNDVVGEKIRLLANPRATPSVSPWLVTSLNCELANGRTFSVVY